MNKLKKGLLLYWGWLTLVFKGLFWLFMATMLFVVPVWIIIVGFLVIMLIYGK